MRTTRTQALAERRNREIAAIHACRNQLSKHMDEAAYRALVARISAEHGEACTSSADMDGKQRRALLNELRAQGATRGPGKPTTEPYPGRPGNVDQLPEYFAKVEAQLASMGLSWAYADAIVKQQTGIAKVAWLKKELHWIGLIAALDVEQEKRSNSAAIDERLRELQLQETAIPEAIRIRNWRRHRKALTAALMWLSSVAEERSRAAEADHG